MLANPEITDGALIQALVASHYEKAYRRALERGAGPQQARPAACRALAMAIHQRRRFGGATPFGGAIPLDDWIVQLVDKAIADLKDPIGPATILTEGDSAEEIDLTRIQAEVELALAGLRQRERRATRLRRWIMAGVGAVLLGLLLWLAGNDQVFQALGQDSGTQFNFPYETQPGDTLNSIAKMAGVTVQDLHPDPGITPDDPLEPGVTYWIPAHPPLRWEGLFPRPPALPKAPLTLASTPAEIKQRILNSPSYWRTLWDDELTLYYGPAGYVAPPVSAFRQQVWLQQPDLGLLIMGSLDGSTYKGGVYFAGESNLYKKRVGNDCHHPFHHREHAGRNGKLPAAGVYSPIAHLLLGSQAGRDGDRRRTECAGGGLV